MLKRRWHILNLIIFLAFLGLNIFIYVNRDDGFAYVGQEGYNRIYYPKETTVIRSIEQRKDSAFIFPEGPESGWRESHGSPYQAVVPLKLEPGKNLYFLESRRGKKLSVGLNYTPSAEYRKQKRDRQDVLELYYSSAPVTSEQLFPLSDWLYVDERATVREKTEGLSLIGGAMHIGPSERTEIKVLKTVGYILQKLDTKRGIPAGFMDSLSPLQRFSAAIAGKSAVWCGDFASIFSYFMFLEGIPVRLVALEGKSGDAVKAGHVFNEVYFRELQRWVMVDLTSKALIIADDKGKFLNAQELFAAHKVFPDQLRLITFEGQTLGNADYETVKGFYDYYFQSNSHFVYYLRTQFQRASFTTFQKLKRYFFRAPTFLVYDPAESIDNSRFFQKQAAAVGLVLFAVYWLLATLLIHRKAAI